MKKILIIILLLGLGIGGYYLYHNKNSVKEIAILPIEESKVSVNKYYIYGTKLNMEASFKVNKSSYKKICLTLYNGKFKDIDINYTEDVNNITFNLAEEINNGLYLDNIKKGKYYMFIKVIYEDEETKKEKYEYYVLDNKTTYNETTYYTISNYNNKIVINSDNDYKTMMLNINQNNNKNKYDIVIDPGHGGMDGGAESVDKKYCEKDFTLDIADKLKVKLEQENIKVKLTHEDLSTNTLLEEYGEHGRAVISSEVKAKYLLSIHINSNNSTKVSGLEIYTPVGINYDFAESLVENITSETGLSVSSGKTNKMFDGIYSKNFSANDISNSMEKYAKQNLKAYDVTTNSNYYYMIRETGGIITGGYVDDRNEEILANPYYNSNTGTESYILELGYITNNNDLDILINKQDQYVDAIVSSIKKQLGLERNTEKDK